MLLWLQLLICLVIIVSASWVELRMLMLYVINIWIQFGQSH